MKINSSSPFIFRGSSIGIGIFVIFLFLEITGFRSTALKPIEFLLQPFQQMVYVTRLQLERIVDFSFSYSQMVTRLAYLENKTAELSAQVSSLESVQKENEALRKMIENTDRTLGSRVVTVPIVSASVPMIAAGTDQGLEPGMMVTVSNTLIGTISEVSRLRATVTLLERARDAGVVAETKSGVQGVILGTGSGVVITHIPRDEKIEVGEQLHTVGQEGIKRGLFLGVVSENLTKEEDAMQTFRVDQFVSFFTSSLVEVWKE